MFEIAPKVTYPVAQPIRKAGLKTFLLYEQVQILDYGQTTSEVSVSHVLPPTLPLAVKNEYLITSWSLELGDNKQDNRLDY